METTYLHRDYETLKEGCVRGFWSKKNRKKARVRGFGSKKNYEKFRIRWLDSQKNLFSEGWYSLSNFSHLFVNFSEKKTFLIFQDNVFGRQASVLKKIICDSGSRLGSSKKVIGARFFLWKNLRFSAVRLFNEFLGDSCLR